MSWDSIKTSCFQLSTLQSSWNGSVVSGLSQQRSLAALLNEFMCLSPWWRQFCHYLCLGWQVSGAGIDLSERLLIPGFTCRHSLAAVRSELSIAARFRNISRHWWAPLHEMTPTSNWSKLCGRESTLCLNVTFSSECNVWVPTWSEGYGKSMNIGLWKNSQFCLQLIFYSFVS